MGMPGDGPLAQQTIQQRIHRDVPTCGLDEDLTAVKKVGWGDWNICVVVDSNGTVPGLLDLDVVQDSHGVVKDFIKPAPLTLRPGILIDAASVFFEESTHKFALLTKSNGQLIGVIRKVDFEGSRDR